MNKANNIFKSNPIPENYSPKNILIIRLQAIGDVAITLPYCSALKKLFPSANIDFLTNSDSKLLPSSLSIFRTVYDIELNYTDSKKYISIIRRYLRVFKTALQLRKNRYDVVLDLQNNNISRAVRKKIHPNYFGEFDRFSPLSAGIRTMNTFINAGFNIEPDYKLKVKVELLINAKDTLIKNGWDRTKQIFVLNPTGLWETRNWMVENYVKLAELISANYNACFLLLGTKQYKDKTEIISSYLDNKVINLVDKTNLSEAFVILQFTSAVISEDSGLMHMAWVSGVPTLALLGSSRADWTSPIGNHTLSLNSSDLECGNCMSPHCKYNDVHCLTRYTPEYVFEKLKSIV